MVEKRSGAGFALGRFYFGPIARSDFAAEELKSIDGVVAASAPVRRDLSTEWRSSMATTSGSYANQTRDIEDRARKAGSQLGDTASDLASKASEQIEGAMHGAEQTARQVAEQGREAGERMQEVAGNFKSAVDKSVRDQPMATLAVAAALGFVIGALWKS